MKNIALLMLICFTFQSCQGNTAKNNLADKITSNTSSDADDIMEDLEGILEAVKSNDYETLTSKYLVSEDHIQDFSITYGQNTGYWRTRFGLHLTRGKLQFFKTIKEKLVGTNINTEDIEPIYLVGESHTTLKGLKRRKLTLFFGDKSAMYEMELYLIIHNGKRLYAFKKEIEKVSKDSKTVKAGIKEYKDRLKESDPEEYKQMIFEEY